VTIKQRLDAAQKLTQSGIPVLAMMGPYWPFFTEPEQLFKEFKKAGVSHVFSESFNTVGGNWTGVEKILRKHYPKLFLPMERIMLNKKNFDIFYSEAVKKIKAASKKYDIPITVYFGSGHAGKFQENKNAED